jgi:hypothetical protein
LVAVIVYEHTNVPPSDPSAGLSTAVPEKPLALTVYVSVKLPPPVPGMVHVVTQLEPLVVGVVQLSVTVPPSSVFEVGGHEMVDVPLWQSAPPLAVEVTLYVTSSMVHDPLEPELELLHAATMRAARHTGTAIRVEWVMGRSPPPLVSPTFLLSSPSLPP